METLVCLAAFFLVFGGVAGVFLPVIPSPLLAWCGFLLCYLGWENGPVNGTWLAVAGGLTLFAHAFEFVGSYFGAKWFGASWRGAVGALLGGIVGPFLFFFIFGAFFLGLIIGPIIGAVAGELIGRRPWDAAAKAGFGTIVGGLSAMLLKLFVSLFLLVGLIGLVTWHVGSPWAKRWLGEPPAVEQPVPSSPDETGGAPAVLTSESTYLVE